MTYFPFYYLSDLIPSYSHALKLLNTLEIFLLRCLCAFFSSCLEYSSNTNTEMLVFLCVPAHCSLLIFKFFCSPTYHCNYPPLSRFLIPISSLSFSKALLTIRNTRCTYWLTNKTTTKNPVLLFPIYIYYKAHAWK
jgi:hypothetical protein